MIQKWYEVTCDYCGAGINHYIGSRPTREMLEADGAVCTATKHFCSETCWGEWNHDCQQRQYQNLQPDGRIHNDL